MARIIDAFTQFFDDNGAVLANGYLQFFQNETAITEPTYNDPEQLVDNPVNLPLDGAGRMSLNAYVSVLCTIKLFNSVNSQVDSEDNVEPRGGLTAGAAFAFWNNTDNYPAIISFTTGSDGEIYQAKTNNTGIDPVVDFAAGGVNWKRKEFYEFWTADETYPKNEIKLSTVDGLEYISTKGSNIGVEPSGDTTGANWVIYVKATDWAIGREYTVGKQAISKVDYRRYRSQITQTGNEPSADNGTNWIVIDGIVTTPVNALPADAATDVSKTPLLTTDAYAITGSINEQEWIQYQLSDDAFSTVLYDSGITRDLTGHTVTTALESATVYSYRAITKGVRTDITDFSTVTTFTTVPALSEIFAINSDTGSGALRTTVTGVDLLTNSGSIWIKNRDTTGFIKQLDTARNLNELDIAENTVESVNANGLQQYLANGFEVGTDASYNASGDTISSYTFQEAVGFYDTVEFLGNGITRDIAHTLGVEVGALIIKTKDGTPASFSKHQLYHKDLGTNAIYLDGSANQGSVFKVATSATFGVISNGGANTSGENYIVELFAHNPAQGIFCGTYTGTGSAGLKLTTGFPVGLLITIYFDVVTGGTMIADIKTGTSSHIHANTLGNIEVAGSVASFDSDGVTLDSNNLNKSAETYYYIAVADPDQF